MPPISSLTDDVITDRVVYVMLIKESIVVFEMHPSVKTGNVVWGGEFLRLPKSDHPEPPRTTIIPKQTPLVFVQVKSIPATNFQKFSDTSKINVNRTQTHKVAV